MIIFTYIFCFFIIFKHNFTLTLTLQFIKLEIFVWITWIVTWILSVESRKKSIKAGQDQHISLGPTKFL